jgi:hypothetical protein
MTMQKQYMRYLQCIMILIFCLIFMGRFAGSGAIRSATDPAVAGASSDLAITLEQTRYNWGALTLLGHPRGPGIGIPSLLHPVLPGILSSNWNYPLACLLASFVFLLGISKTKNPLALLIGGITAFWIGTNFTLLYAGHDFKAYVVLFFVCTIAAANISSFWGSLIWVVARG